MKNNTLFNQVNLKVASDIKFKHIQALKLNMEALVEQKEIKSVRILLDDEEIVTGEKNSKFNLLGFKNFKQGEFLIYDSGEETYSLEVIFSSESLLILLSVIFTSFLLLLLTGIYFLRNSVELWESNTLKAHISTEKNKMAGRIFHLLKSDILQINNLIDDKKNMIDQNSRLLIKSAVNSALSGASKFIKINNGKEQGEVKLKRLNLYDFMKLFIDGKIAEYEEIGRKQLHFKQKSFKDIYIQSNEEELRHILSNLINNSFEAISEDEHIEVSCNFSNGIAEIIIKDNGRGLPSEILEKLQMSGYSYGKENGNGIGLSQAREKVKLLNGELDISSIEGEDFTAKVSFLGMRESDGKRVDVYLVDDNPLRRMNSVKMAEGLGMTMKTFPNIKELKESFTDSPDIAPLILDSDLGEEVSGEIAAKELYDHYGFKDITIYSGKVDIEEELKDFDWISSVKGKDRYSISEELSEFQR